MKRRIGLPLGSDRLLPEKDGLSAGALIDEDADEAESVAGQQVPVPVSVPIAGIGGGLLSQDRVSGKRQRLLAAESRFLFGTASNLLEESQLSEVIVGHQQSPARTRGHGRGEEGSPNVDLFQQAGRTEAGNRPTQIPAPGHPFEILLSFGLGVMNQANTVREAVTVQVNKAGSHSRIDSSGRCGLKRPASGIGIPDEVPAAVGGNSVASKHGPHHQVENTVPVQVHDANRPPPVPGTGDAAVVLEDGKSSVVSPSGVEEEDDPTSGAAGILMGAVGGRGIDQVDPAVAVQVPGVQVEVAGPQMPRFRSAGRLQVSDRHGVPEPELAGATDPGVADDSSRRTIRRISVDDRSHQIPLSVSRQVHEGAQDGKRYGFRLPRVVAKQVTGADHGDVWTRIQRRPDGSHPKADPIVSPLRIRHHPLDPSVLAVVEVAAQGVRQGTVRHRIQNLDRVGIQNTLDSGLRGQGGEVDPGVDGNLGEREGRGDAKVHRVRAISRPRADPGLGESQNQGQGSQDPERHGRMLLRHQQRDSNVSHPATVRYENRKNGAWNLLGLLLRTKFRSIPACFSD